jgi:hypothetical protein
MDSTADQARKGRLIVIIPDCLAGNRELAHKIFWIALRERCNVLYFTLVEDHTDMLSLSQRMAAMNAATGKNCTTVDSMLVNVEQWLKTLRQTYSPGDRIVCHEEQLVKQGFRTLVPITDFLHDALNFPVFSLSGFYHPQQIQVRKWMHEVFAWLGFMIILAGFTVLEIQLDHFLLGIIGKVVLCILLTFEILAIWAWNNFTQ